MSESKVYVRTCAECGHKQLAKDPKTYKTAGENWRDLKCKHCKSAALDYGSDSFTMVNGKIVKVQVSDW